MKSAVRSHPKTGRLMRRLCVCRATAVGVLNLLWDYASRQAKDGSLHKVTSEDAAEILGVEEGAPALLALRDSGWLDDHPAGHGFIIHDWLDHCEGYVIRDLQAGGRLPKAWIRGNAIPDGFYTYDPHDNALQRTAQPCSREGEGEGLCAVNPDRKTTAAVTAPARVKPTACTEAQAREIYAAYPRHEGRRAALAAICAAAARLAAAGNTDPAGYLLAAVTAYAASPRVKQGERKFIPHPATWFNQERYDDDRAEWQAALVNHRHQPDRNRQIDEQIARVMGASQ